MMYLWNCDDISANYMSHLWTTIDLLYILQLNSLFFALALLIETREAGGTYAYNSMQIRNNYDIILMKKLETLLSLGYDLIIKQQFSPITSCKIRLNIYNQLPKNIQVLVVSTVIFLHLTFS